MNLNRGQICPSQRPAWWNGFDFSPCFRFRALEEIVPLVLVALALLYFALEAYLSNQPIKLDTSEDSDDDPVRDAEIQVIRSVAAQESQDAAIALGFIDVQDIAKQNGHGPAEIISLKPFMNAQYSADRRYNLIQAIVATVLVGLFLARAILLSQAEGAVTIIAWIGVNAICYFKLLRPESSHSPFIDNSLAIYYFYAWFTSVVNMRSFLYTSKASTPSTAIQITITSIITLNSLYLLLRPRSSCGAIPLDSAPSEFKPASLLSLATYDFLTPLIYRASKTIGAIQAPEVHPDGKPATALYNFRTMGGWTTKRSLRTRMLWFFRSELMKQQAWAWVESITRIGPAVFLRFVLEALSKKRQDPAKRDLAIVYAFLMFASQLLASVAGGQSLIIGRRISVKMKGILSGEIYAKTLRRADRAAGGVEDMKSSGAGRITNMMSVDVYRTSEISAYLHFIWPATFVQITLAVILLFRLLGLSAVAGLVVLALQVPIQSGLSKLYLKYSTRLLAAADKRLHLVQEIIQAVRVVKFFAWQSSFSERLHQARQEELSLLLKRTYTTAAQNVFMLGGSVLISAATFWVHTLILGRSLDAATAFTAIALFNVVRAPSDNFSVMIVYVLNANVSLGRIAEFLAEPDSEKWSNLDVSCKTADTPHLGCTNAIFDWEEPVASEPTLDVLASLENPKFRLRAQNLDFPVGRISLVVGPVGSGKTMLLLSLLGETHVTAGSVFSPSPIFRQARSSIDSDTEDSLAYCSQSAWLLSDTVRENVTFGSPWNEKRYKDVLQACALVPDLAQFPEGDQTEVGERGTVLSGGQKARLSLARALYSPAKHLLLDDIIAAVDAQTARMLVATLSGPLMKDRTCILVSHAVSLLAPICSYMVVLDAGEVLYNGLPDEAPKHLTAMSDRIDEKPPQSEGHATDEHVSSDKKELDITPVADSKVLPEKRDEEAQTGAVDWRIYKVYAAAIGGLGIWLLIVFAYAISQSAEVSMNYWLQLWAQSYDSAASSVAQHEDQPDRETTVYYLTVYCGLAVLTLALYGIRTAIFLSRTVVAGKRLYARLFDSVLGARVRFFDITPVGRILNRLSRDSNTIDQELGGKMQFLFVPLCVSIATAEAIPLRSFLEIAWTVGILATIVAVMPSFLIFGFLMGIFYAYTTHLYLSGSRELKRAESVGLSPMYGVFGETLNGVTTIRAYGDGSRFMQKMFRLQNDNLRPFYSLWLANRWLSFRTDLGGAAVTLIVALSVILSKTITAALAGFVLSYAMTFQSRLLWVARLSAELQIDGNCIERVNEYLHLPQESTQGLKPPDSWPSRSGIIKVSNLTARYAPHLPPVLKNVSFTIEPRQKVAVVGRTGSGKSTLALTFFRFLDAESGSIEIDGLDISKLNLQDLRSRLTIIPQDATLFSGTIRFNLDPFGKHDDHQLWDALKRCQMIANTPGHTPRPSRPGSSLRLSELQHDEDGTQTPAEERVAIRSLDDPVTEGGKNFSVGQRQLLALARGLLKLSASNILILDESTASLDAKTDERIQQTIRSEMEDATLICIAHRLTTIIDYDRVLVLGEGCVLEYDSPSNLLDNPSSHFAALCRQAGRNEFDELKRLAGKKGSTS